MTEPQTETMDTAEPQVEGLSFEAQAKIVGDDFFNRVKQGKTYDEVLQEYGDKFTPEQLKAYTEEFFNLSQSGQLVEAIELLQDKFKDDTIAVGLMAPYVELEFLKRRIEQDNLTTKTVDENVAAIEKGRSRV